jgi:hypothetical protein
VQRGTAMKNPSWWNDEHESTWGRIKSALKRDWEQTKADVSSRGHDLDQSVGDTVKQALGKEPIPPGNQPNTKVDDWEDVEPEYRYGAGARQHHGGSWDQVQAKMSEEWNDLKSGRTWDEVKSRVRRGWDHDGDKK